MRRLPLRGADLVLVAMQALWKRAGVSNNTIMARSRPVQPDDDLELAGLDSMALLKVLLFIEAQYGFWMPDDDLVEENIKTPRAFANYICRRSV